MINTDCSTCPFADKCYMKDKFQRHPRSEGGLGLCPKVELVMRRQPAERAILLAKSATRAVQRFVTTEPAGCSPMNRLYRTSKGTRKTVHSWHK